MIEILITSSVLIVSLLILRKLFRNSLSRRVQYALWGLVLFRLLVPVRLPASELSVMTSVHTAQAAVERRLDRIPVRNFQPAVLPSGGQGQMREDHTPAPTLPDTARPDTLAASGENASTANRPIEMGKCLFLIWTAGAAAAAAFLLAVNLSFWFKLRRSRRPYPAEGCPLRVYLVETGLSSPCLFGIFRPSVYLTPAALASPERLAHVLAHEEAHARHLDHLWTFLRGLCLAVYWFDPLVWIASAAAKTDCELACDESVLIRLGEGERISYGQTLLSLIPVKRAGNPMLAATTMAAGKKQLKDRFRRIAQRPKQFAAAAVAVVLLAGIISACTFSSGVTAPAVSAPGSKPEAPQEDAGLQALTGDELRFFNEQFFNGGGVRDEYGNGAASIVNQFANPMNLYEKPEDIDINELFYCHGTVVHTGEEAKDVFGMEELPGAPAFKVTAEEVDRILTQYAGLTLEQTNKVNLDYTEYSADYNAYYWMHGDTNYPGDLYFSAGTRAGKEIKLYQNSLFSPGWYCVTLEEQGAGSYWFKANQECEKPVIPTPFPAGEPDAAIPLDGLEPYEAPAVTLEVRTGDFWDTYENRLANWSIDNHNILLYRTTDGTVNAALRENDQRKVFLTDLGEDARMFFYSDLFGHNGFTVSYYGQVSEEPRSFGMCVNYYYFDEDGTLKLLAQTGKNNYGPNVMDLDGDGTNELASETELFFQRDGQIYRANLYQLVLDNCPAMDYWDNAFWDQYAKCLVIRGLGDPSAGCWDVARWLYFDGENDQLLLYKDTRTWSDHVMEGVERYAPPEVVSAAKDYVEQEVIVSQPDGTWRHKGYEDEGWPQEAYDDWRIENIAHETTQDVDGITLECWTFNYELHTTTPEEVILAGGKYMTEDHWVSPGYPNCDWLFFRLEGGKRTLLWQGMANDITPGSELFDQHLAYILEENGLTSGSGRVHPVE